ncbi:MAG: hypothetical protein ACFFCQ_05955 [Promethearchaeota archaeon]
MKSIAVDTSFLINMHILGLLDQLCKICDPIFITPSVWEETSELHSLLLKLRCIKRISLSEEERKVAQELHDEFTRKYKGTHHGEIEALVVATFRKIPLILCDNFAPWYLQKLHRGLYLKPQIARGHSAVEKMLSEGCQQ